MQVYVVVANWCDDTWIDSVWATQELAAQAIAKVKPVNANNPSSTGAWVEVWEVQGHEART